MDERFLSLLACRVSSISGLASSFYYYVSFIYFSKFIHSLAKIYEPMLPLMKEGTLAQRITFQGQVITPFSCD